MFKKIYAANVARRRAFRLNGYLALADAGFDGDYVSPIQITSCSADGPVLLAWHWFDAPSAARNRDVLRQLGYLPGIPFNRVLDQALSMAGLSRQGIYITQCFHLLPAERSARPRVRDVDLSFDTITRHELEGRRVIALGSDAAKACSRFGITPENVVHPSGRGPGMTDVAKARLLAAALA